MAYPLRRILRRRKVATLRNYQRTMVYAAAPHVQSLKLHKAGTHRGINDVTQTRASTIQMNEQVAEEQLLPLPDGRTLAYASTGTTSSSSIVIFFHGVFGIGTATSPLSPALVEKDVHFVAPTLPGWGNSSPVPSHVTFHDQLYLDITALLSHLRPDHTDELELYVCGGSFGTAPAQILYGAPYEKFPLGRCIRGMLLLAPLSPFPVHKGYTKCLSWSNYIAVGPPSRLLPFKLTSRLAKAVMKGKVDTPQHAEEFMEEFVLKKMSPAEKELCDKWKAAKGIKDGEEMKNMAVNVHRSVQKSWEGFMTVPDILHSTWGGYSPADLDDEHAKPVLLFLTKEDWEMKSMGEWLAAQLKSARIMYGEGGHVGSLFVLDDIWAEFMSHFA